jgi:hypothetical protein
MEVFNSDHGSNILGCGNLCTAGSQIFKTKEFTWFSEVNYFQCVKFLPGPVHSLYGPVDKFEFYDPKLP